MSLRKFTDFENSIEEEAIKHAESDAAGAKKDMLDAWFKMSDGQRKSYSPGSKLVTSFANMSIEILEDNKIAVYMGKGESRVILQFVGFETEKK